MEKSGSMIEKEAEKASQGRRPVSWAMKDGFWFSKQRTEKNHSKEGRQSQSAVKTRAMVRDL